MTTDDIIAVIERGMCHGDKAAECDVCATKRRAIAEVRTGREQLLAALAGIAERDAEIERLREEIAALRAEVERHERTGAYALGFTDGEGRTRALVAELKATVSAQDREREECRAELARLRARDERTARVIEAAKETVEEDEARETWLDPDEPRGRLRAAVRALDDATDAAEIEAAHDLGAACGASVEERAAHRWSGWPGAWCLDCGIQDPREACLASGECPCGDQVAAPCKVRVPPCTEPGSRRHDPYAERSVEERAAEGAGVSGRLRAMAEFDRRAWIRAADAKAGGPLALYFMAPDAVLMEVDRGTREECEETRGRLRRTVEAIVCTALDAEGPGVERATERHRARTQQRIGACLSMPPELAEAELRAISEAEQAEEESER